MKQCFILFQYLIPQHLLSRMIGFFAELEWKPIKNFLIKSFIKSYQVNMQEAEQSSPEAYDNFNDFFTRALKVGARPIDTNSHSIISPADGEISDCGMIDSMMSLAAKGHHYSMADLLASSEHAGLFAGGQFMTTYLAPKDYHRVHMPISGRLIEMTHVPGALFSVNQTTTDSVEGLFARNERIVCLFEAEKGPIAVVMIGAMIVASIETTWAGIVTPPPKKQPRVWHYSENFHPNIYLNKGDELGRFRLGSTAIMLFPKDTMEWLPEMRMGTIVRCGQKVGMIN